MNSIVYLISGPSHIPYLVVSLRSLRKHWNGPIFVYSYPESYEILSQVAKDPLLAIEVRKTNPSYRGKNSQFIEKIQVMKRHEFWVNLYLDADTTVHGNISPLFDLADRVGFCGTQFCHWKSNSKKPAGRIRQLLGRQYIDDTAVRDAMENPWPSPNGGVFCCIPSSPVLEAWYKQTWSVRDLFIADECVLHSLMVEYGREQKMVVAEGGIWNCSPKHKPDAIDEKDVVIWHYHGDSNVRPKKSLRGHSIWWPQFEEAMKENVGGICDWLPTTENQWIFELMRTAA